MGHGRALVNVENNKEQIELYKKIVKKSLSVREVEKLVQALKSKTSKEYNLFFSFYKSNCFGFRKIF